MTRGSDVHYSSSLSGIGEKPPRDRGAAEAASRRHGNIEEMLMEIPGGIELLR